jgi:hypothetical protein
MSEKMSNDMFRLPSQQDIKQDSDGYVKSQYDVDVQRQAIYVERAAGYVADRQNHETLASEERDCLSILEVGAQVRQIRNETSPASVEGSSNEEFNVPPDDGDADIYALTSQMSAIAASVRAA